MMLVAIIVTNNIDLKDDFEGHRNIENLYMRYTENVLLIYHSMHFFELNNSSNILLYF